MSRLPLDALAACELFAREQRRSVSGFIRGCVLDEIARLQMSAASAPAPALALQKPAASHADILAGLAEHEARNKQLLQGT